MEKYCLYIHEFPNKKVYIGISLNYKRRWKSGCGYKKTPRIYNAIKKYGWENIRHILVKTNLSKEEACELEKNYIKLYNSNKKEFGYNLTTGGESGYKRGVLHKEQARQRMLGNKYSEGRIISEETRERMVQSAKKRGFTKEQKRKMEEFHNREVNQYDLDGNFIRSYKSGTEYAKSIGKKSGSLISKCCNKNTKAKTAYGFKWEFAEKGEKNE